MIVGSPGITNIVQAMDRFELSVSDGRSCNLVLLSTFNVSNISAFYSVFIYDQGT